MKTQIYLIRHGECEHNKLYGHLIGGQSNHSPLTNEGINQAELLGEYLKKKGIKFDKVFSSPAVRAISTAKIALSKTCYPLEEIILSDELLELDQGDFVGIHRDKVYTEETRKIINSDPWNFSAPNGESQKQVEERMLKFINENIIGQDYGSVAIFGHGLAIKCAFRGIMNFDPHLTYKLKLDNTAITEFTYDGDGLILNHWNDVSHLR